MLKINALVFYKGKKVIKPGSTKGDKDEYVKFESLSRNAGIVNMYEAVKMAEKFSNAIATV